MKRIAKLLARFYPAAWRERYGEEFQGLIEDKKLGASDLLDVFCGGLKMQVTSQSFVRIILPCALAGATAGLCTSFIHPTYTSKTLIVQSGLTPADDATPANQAAEQAELASVVSAAYERDALASIIRRYDLYPRERAKMAMSDVVAEMRKHILIAPLSPDTRPGRSKGPADRYVHGGFLVEFAYPDPRVAQQVDADLTGLLMRENLRQSIASKDKQRLESLNVAEGASLPLKPNGLPRSIDAAIGLLLGLMCGVMLAAVMSNKDLRVQRHE